MHPQVIARAVSSGKSRGAGFGPAAPWPLPTRPHLSPSNSPAGETPADPGTPRRCLITNSTTAKADPSKQTKKPSSHWNYRGRVVALLACGAISYSSSPRTSVFFYLASECSLTSQPAVRAASPAYRTAQSGACCACCACWGWVWHTSKQPHALKWSPGNFSRACWPEVLD